MLLGRLGADAVSDNPPQRGCMVFEEPLPEALNCNPPRPIMKVLSSKVPEAPYGYTIMGVDRPLPYWTRLMNLKP